MGLDVGRLDALAREIRRQAREHGLAVIVATHRMDFAAALADQILTQAIMVSTICIMACELALLILEFSSP